MLSILKYSIFVLAIVFLINDIPNPDIRKDFKSEEINADIFIDVTVIDSTETSTISKFSIDEGKVTGVFLERPGGTPEEESRAGSLKRIPPGIYEFVKNDCNRYINSAIKRKNCAFEFRLKTSSNPLAGTRDLILIHAGNYPMDTAGCLLPGEEHFLNAKSTKEVFNKKTRTKKKEIFYSDKVISSGTKLKDMSDYINKRISELKFMGRNDITMKIRLR